MRKNDRSGFVQRVSCSAVAIACSMGLAHAEDGGRTVSAWEASRAVDDNDMITTGVAKGRDRLDSATSTSVIKEAEINKLGAHSLADLLRNVPGLRVEASTGETGNSYTVRGLPLVNAGAKYLQLQEDGLPVLEYGDFFLPQPDNFIRTDLNIGQIESIRGGSASTFASNAPGGVINLISKTGEVEGGSVQLSSGLNYDTNRVDIDYGGHLSDKTRFHIGGFYRQGEGPRNVGYSALNGGQVKFNITHDFTGGYIRVYGKVLDDQVPYYWNAPAAISGTDGNAKLGDLPNFNVNRDSVLSRYLTQQTVLDAGNRVVTNNMHDGVRSKVKSIGVETKFTLADWSFTERFRYSDISGLSVQVVPLGVMPGADVAAIFSGQPGGRLSYANGPQAGAAINPDTVNGNGLIAFTGLLYGTIHSLRNVTNDFRGSRVWSLGGGDLTTTAGVYKSRQDLDTTQLMTTVLQDVRGNGESALVNLTRADGTALTQNGVLTYGLPGQTGQQQRVNVRYDVTAPYASFNYHRGKIAIGASLRYDYGRVQGTAAQDVSTRPQDMNGDGIIDAAGPEGAVAYFAPEGQRLIHYSYHYISYSTGINYRLAEHFSLFARYSRGARGGGDSLLFTPAIDPRTGALVDRSAAYDPVRQAEGGFKFRQGGISVNLTGFYAWTRETNTQIYQDANGNQIAGVVKRGYRTYGAELEASIRRGPFSAFGSATLSGGTITAADDPTLVGNRPRHQPTLLYTLTPQYDVDRFTIGANIIGQTSVYAQDVNLLKIPGYTTFGMFVQLRPVERLVLAVNASNLFDTKAATDIADPTMPSYGAVSARLLYGRLVTASARVFF